MAADSKSEIADWWKRACPELSRVNADWRNHCRVRRGGTRQYNGPRIPGAPEPDMIFWYVNVDACTATAGVRIIAKGRPDRACDIVKQMCGSRKDIERGFGEPLKWEWQSNKSVYWIYWENPICGGFCASSAVQEKAIKELARAMRRLVAATEGIVRNLV